MGKLDADEKGRVLNDTRGGTQIMLTVNESGMYSLIMHSRKPVAKTFKKWVTSEVLPSIRKTGSTQSCVGATPMKDLIHVLENFIGGAAATAIATQMRQWGKRVPAPAPPPQVMVPAVAPNAKALQYPPAPFKDSGFQVAGIYIKQDSEGRYCLNDLHKASGNVVTNKPANWMQLQKTKDFIDEILIDGIPAVRSMAGKYGGTFVCKELVYHYAMWISPAFSLKVIRAYDALVTGQLSPISKDDQLLLVESFELQKRLSARLDVLLLETINPLTGLGSGGKLVSHTIPQRFIFLPNTMLRVARFISKSNHYFNED